MRPRAVTSDNPLIVHIAEISQLRDCVPSAEGGGETGGSFCRAGAPYHETKLTPSPWRPREVCRRLPCACPATRLPGSLSESAAV